MSTLRKGLAGKVALGASAALLAVAVHGTGLAFVSRDASPVSDLRDSFIAFTPADADPRLARVLAERGGETRMMRFTPAGAAAAAATRSITVSVRVDPETADALAVRSALDGSRGQTRASALNVTPTRYNLGLARGYSSFAQAPVAPAPATRTLSGSLSRTDVPDLADFAPSPGVREEPSRFAARIALDEDSTADNAAVSGERLTDQMLDVAGSYSLTRNFDITAGVRYEQDRDLLPVPNIDQQDSQAVYIGTQFRF